MCLAQSRVTVVSLTELHTEAKEIDIRAKNHSTPNSGPQIYVGSNAAVATTKKKQ